MTTSSERPIAEWWPNLSEPVRAALVNGLWLPLSDYAHSEIKRLGGPHRDDEYFSGGGEGVSLPPDAVVWIVASDDFGRLKEPVREDPRVAYFRRSWPRR